MRNRYESQYKLQCPDCYDRGIAYIREKHKVTEPSATTYTVLQCGTNVKFVVVVIYKGGQIVKKKVGRVKEIERGASLFEQEL